MKNPFVLLLRLIALRRNESNTPHGLHPLNAIREATVLVAPQQEDSDAVRAAVSQFFSYNNIPVHIFCPTCKDIDLAGTIKKKSRGERAAQGAGELLISLADPEDAFWAEYEARCSRACFKIGRRQLKGDVFDLVILPPESGNIPSQSAVFSEIKNYLNIIR